MANTAQITCINKIPRNDPNESITHVGGQSIDGRWKLTLADAIGRIERGEWKFYVAVNGKSVWVVVAISRAGNKYLKTEADSSTQNNLLSLPECA
jgi:hypothetical protein